MNNNSRYAFTHDVFSTTKGKWLQWGMKKIIAGMIEGVHEQIQKRYDGDAYVFDDIRLRRIKEFTEAYFKENMEQRKQDILNNGVDIFLFFMKEDMFYRSRLFDMMAKWNHVFGLDSVEMDNLRRWKGK